MKLSKEEMSNNFRRSWASWGAVSLLWIGMVFFPLISALAQGEGELTLTLSRDFGYSSGDKSRAPLA